MSDRTSEEKLANRIAAWETRGVEAIKNDLMHHDGIKFVGGSPEVRDQAWAWVHEQEAGDAVKAKPFSWDWLKINSGPLTLLLTLIAVVIGGLWAVYERVVPADDAEDKTEVTDMVETPARVSIVESIDTTNMALSNSKAYGPSLCNPNCVLALEWVPDECNVKMLWSDARGDRYVCDVPIGELSVVRATQTSLLISACSEKGKSYRLEGTAQNMYDVLSTIKDWEPPDFCLQQGEQVFKPVSVSKAEPPVEQRQLPKKRALNMAEVEMAVRTTTALVYDQQLSSVTLNTRFEDIENPDVVIPGIMVVALIVEIEKQFKCAITDEVAGRIFTVSEAVLAVMSCE